MNYNFFYFFLQFKYSVIKLLLGEDMKKIIFVLILSICSMFPCFAIDWIELKNSKNAVLMLDIDSIKEYAGYYFFNVNMKTAKSSNIVITMQCVNTHPFCARIEYRDYSDYVKNNGNYELTTSKITKRLEPVPFDSLAYIAYRKVDKLIGNKKTEIVF